MAYEQEVKELAYRLDPSCWVSYAGRPRPFKSAMDGRRTIALESAQKQFDARRDRAAAAPEISAWFGEHLDEHSSARDLYRALVQLWKEHRECPSD